MKCVDMVSAIEDAEATLQLADLFTNRIAAMIVGRLKSGQVEFNILCKLKKELKKFNMHTGQWK